MFVIGPKFDLTIFRKKFISQYVRNWHLLQPKGNIIASIVFIPAKKKTPKIRGSFAIFLSKRSMLKAIPANKNGISLLFFHFEDFLLYLKMKCPALKCRYLSHSSYGNR